MSSFPEKSIRSIKEIIEMLKEAADGNDYFEIGPKEAQILWNEFQRLRDSEVSR